jgi:LPS-assembly lipoprotein
MTPAGQPASPTYQLTVTLHEAKVPLGIRKDETATRANMIQTAEYFLRDLTSHVVVNRGTVQATTSYNIVNSDFGTISAERDARVRGIEIVAEAITLRVALYFNRRGTLTRKAAVNPAPVRVVQKK